MLPRKRHPSQRGEAREKRLGLTWSLISLSLIVLLISYSKWARHWMITGAAVETILILLGSTFSTRIFPSVPLWTLLASFNLVYAVLCTSWLLSAIFTILCWPFVVLTCLFQFELCANQARKALRSVLRDLHFTRDRIAFFNLPALEIDTEVDGLLVIRGITISLSDLTLVAHGIEVGIKLTDEIELALSTDEVRVPLFRGIEVSDVYANIKGGKSEMTFADMPDDEGEQDDASFFHETPLLRAATAGREEIKGRRPSLRENMTGGSYIMDTSAKGGFDTIRTLAPHNQAAEKQYLDMLTQIRTTSAIYQSRARARQSQKEAGVDVDDEKDLRAAVCAELHNFPSVPHPPQASVKVTTLQNLSKPAVRRFMHRLPFLLRLLLSPLGYLHPVTIASINAAGSGQWLRELLQQFVFKSYAEHSAEIRRLERRMSTWLADANFCVQLTDVDGVGQTPLTTSFDIVAYLHFADIMAYRLVPQSGVLSQVVRLGGADATFTVPIFLLPHHEHLLPPAPTMEDAQHMKEKVEEADGLPKTVQAERELKRVKKDETTISMSVHASLPASFDQDLLAFIAALVKATKIIEFDKEVERMDPDNEDMRPLSRASTAASTTSVDSTASMKASASHKRVQSDITPSSPGSRFKAFTKNIQQNLRDASIDTANAVTKENITNFVKDVQKSSKKAVVGSIVNDRWIAKMVGKIAQNLARAQGDLGYSGNIPIQLEQYRPKKGGDGELTKLLP